MQRKSIYILLIISGILFFSFSSNPPPGRTGGPGEPTCATIGCHSGINVTINGHINLDGLPSTIAPGLTYPIDVQLIIDRGNPLRGGFQLMALTDTEENASGFSNPGEAGALTESNGRNYFGHAPAKNFDGKDTLTYSVDWQLPDSISADSIIFYAAANFANGNGGSAGDRIVTFRESFELTSSTLSLDITSQNPSCADTSDGQITVQPSGGNPPYSYQWSSGQMTSSDSTLHPGIYSITVTDNIDTKDSVIIDISQAMDTEPPVITCFVDTLTINSCVPFSYPVPTAEDNCGTAQVLLLSGKGPNQSFEPGVHLEVYEAIDGQGNSTRCTLVVNNIAVINPEIIVNHIPCYDDSTGGSITLDLSGGNGSFSIELIGDTLSLDQLPEGTYRLLITDQSGCSQEEEVRIERPDSLVLEILNIQHPRNTSSGDGAIDVTVNGGTPPYSFNWRTEGEDFSSEQNLSLLFPGEYILTIEDAQGCLIQSEPIILDAITSIIDPDLSKGLIIWPNPVQHSLNISLDQIPAVKEGYIYNAQGIILLSFNGHSSRIDLTNIGSGVFYLLLELSSGSLVGTRFMKIAD